MYVVQKKYHKIKKVKETFKSYKYYGQFLSISMEMT